MIASQKRSARLTAAIRSASVHCWRGAWSKQACRSSRCLTVVGTITRIFSPACPGSWRPLKHARRVDRRSRPARLAGDDVGRGARRIRPHAQDLHAQRPERTGTRSLVECHVGAVRRLRHAGRAGRRRNGSQGYAAVERVLCPENFASTIYRKLGIDPDKIYYTPEGRPAHLVSDPTPIKELMG